MDENEEILIALLKTFIQDEVKECKDKINHFVEQLNDINFKSYDLQELVDRNNFAQGQIDILDKLVDKFLLGDKL